MIEAGDDSLNPQLFGQILGKPTQLTLNIPDLILDGSKAVNVPESHHRILSAEPSHEASYDGGSQSHTD